MHRCIRMTIRLMITGTDIMTVNELTMIEAMTTSRRYSSHSSMALIESSHATFTVFHPLHKKVNCGGLRRSLKKALVRKFVLTYGINRYPK